MMRIIMFSIVMSLLACDDILVEDISEAQIQLNTPQDGHSSNIGEQRFWWNEVEGATVYNFKIVTPNFDNPVSLKLDTLIQGTSIRVVLEAGSYEWCVNARNSAYETEYECRMIEIAN